MAYYLLVELDVLQNLDGLVVIPKQRMEAQQPHKTEVAQHLIEGVTSVLSSHTLRITWKERKCHTFYRGNGLSPPAHLSLPPGH